MLLGSSIVIVFLSGRQLKVSVGTLGTGGSSGRPAGYLVVRAVTQRAQRERRDAAGMGVSSQCGLVSRAGDLLMTAVAVFSDINTEV